MEKAIFKAALAYSRLKSKIVNLTVLKILLDLIGKLVPSLLYLPLQRGLELAHRMSRFYEEKGVFRWCPRLRDWLSDPCYILYLGAIHINLPTYWRGILGPM